MAPNVDEEAKEGMKREDRYGEGETLISTLLDGCPASVKHMAVRKGKK